MKLLARFCGWLLQIAAVLLSVSLLFLIPASVTALVEGKLKNGFLAPMLIAGVTGLWFSGRYFKRLGRDVVRSRWDWALAVASAGLLLAALMILGIRDFEAAKVRAKASSQEIPR